MKQKKELTVIKSMFKKTNRAGRTSKICVETIKNENAHFITMYQLVPESAIDSNEVLVVKKFKDKYLIRFHIGITTETLGNIIGIISEHLNIK